MMEAAVRRLESDHYAVIECEDNFAFMRSLHDGDVKRPILEILESLERRRSGCALPTRSYRHEQWAYCA